MQIFIYQSNYFQVRFILYSIKDTAIQIYLINQKNTTGLNFEILKNINFYIISI